MSRRIYESSNGDTWDLVREVGLLRVRHNANVASGGATTDYELVSFLSLFHQHPQAEELVHLISNLLESAPLVERP